MYVSVWTWHPEASLRFERLTSVETWITERTLTFAPTHRAFIVCVLCKTHENHKTQKLTLNLCWNEECRMALCVGVGG